LTTTTLQKQRNKISHQEGMKEKVPEPNLLIKEIISMEEIDYNLFSGTKVFYMVIVFSFLTLVTNL
jgi:hypothetical protein